MFYIEIKPRILPKLHPECLLARNGGQENNEKTNLNNKYELITLN